MFYIAVIAGYLKREFTESTECRGGAPVNAEQEYEMKWSEKSCNDHDARPPKLGLKCSNGSPASGSIDLESVNSEQAQGLFHEAKKTQQELQQKKFRLSHRITQGYS